MSEKPPKTDKTKAAEGADAVRLKSLGEVVVEHYETPPVAPAGLKIHARRRLPAVPEAKPKPGEEEDKKGE